MPSSFDTRLKKFNSAYDDLIEILAYEVLSEVGAKIEEGLSYDDVPDVTDKKVRNAATLVKKHGCGLAQHPAHIIVSEIYSEMERLLESGDFQEADLFIELEVRHRWDEARNCDVAWLGEVSIIGEDVW